MLYRWPDGLSGLMAVPFLIQSGFSPETIGTVQGGWDISAAIAGTAVGGLFFSKLGLNRALWVYGVIGAFRNLAYWASSIWRRIQRSFNGSDRRKLLQRNDGECFFSSAYELM